MNAVPYVVAAYGFVGALFGSWVTIMVRRNAHRARDGADPDERR